MKLQFKQPLFTYYLGLLGFLLRTTFSPCCSISHSQLIIQRSLIFLPPPPIFFACLLFFQLFIHNRFFSYTIHPNHSFHPLHSSQLYSYLSAPTSTPQLFRRAGLKGTTTKHDKTGHNKTRQKLTYQGGTRK